MDSPCISLCILDEEHGVCRGCYRTLDEIGAWSQYSSEQRRRIMAALDTRRERYQQTQQDSQSGRSS
ncbi:MAG: DUF1289 domain-containing protein [Gammaproteobacteria bacterium]|nr:DUF1289 domain-containing protein [Gammaproteobacteria bacterium]